MRKNVYKKRYLMMYYRNQFILFALLVMLGINSIMALNSYNKVVHIIISFVIGIGYIMFDYYTEVMQQDKKETLIEEEIINKEKTLIKEVSSKIGFSEEYND